MAFGDESAKVLIRPDGTFEFDRKAAKAFHLNDAHSLSVFYSGPSSRFVLEPLSKAQSGVTLEKTQEGGVVAYRAADFLDGAGVLPVTHKKYDARYYADLHVIVVHNVAVCKTKGTK
jgi:hypothetical protein